MAIFSNDPFLSLLSAGDLEALVRLGNEHSYAAGQRILGQGDIDQFVVLIVRGWTVVRIEAQNGRSIIYVLCGPLDVIGEMADLGGGPCSATVTALVDVHARVIPAADFLGFLRVLLDLDLYRARGVLRSEERRIAAVDERALQAIALL